MLASPEDVILAKLEWARDGGSQRQLEDAASVVRTQGDRLDRPYINRWSAELGLGQAWDRIETGRVTPEASP